MRLTSCTTSTAIASKASPSKKEASASFFVPPLLSATLHRDTRLSLPGCHSRSHPCFSADPESGLIQQSPSPCAPDYAARSGPRFPAHLVQAGPLHPAGTLQAFLSAALECPPT